MLEVFEQLGQSVIIGGEGEAYMKKRGAFSLTQLSLTKLPPCLSL